MDTWRSLKGKFRNIFEDKATVMTFVFISFASLYITLYIF